MMKLKSISILSQLFT